MPQQIEYEDYARFWGKRLVEVTSWPGAELQTSPVIAILEYVIQDEAGEWVTQHDNFSDINVELEEMGIMSDPGRDIANCALRIGQGIEHWHRQGQRRFTADLTRRKDLAENQQVGAKRARTGTGPTTTEENSTPIRDIRTETGPVIKEEITEPVLEQRDELPPVDQQHDQPAQVGQQHDELAQTSQSSESQEEPTQAKRPKPRKTRQGGTKRKRQR